MTDVLTIERGTYLVIRTDDSEEVRMPPTLDDMRRARSAAGTLDTVMLARHGHAHSTRSCSLGAADVSTSRLS